MKMKIITSNVISALIAGVLLYLCVPIFGKFQETLQSIETSYFPVIADFELKLLRIEQGNPVFAVIGDKKRNCKPVKLDAYAMYKGVQVEIKLQQMHPTVNVFTDRPLGLNDYGIWKLNSAGIQHVDRLFAIFTHSCNSMWSTKTLVGPIGFVG
jgi:hypothetical protein